jgi:hypothetical protein
MMAKLNFQFYFFALSLNYYLNFHFILAELHFQFYYFVFYLKYCLSFHFTNSTNLIK